MSGYAYGCSGQQSVSPEFAGVDPSVLQTWLTQAQQALQDLTIGGKAESVSYAQDAGSKSVTYTRADIGSLQQRIRDLAFALGLAPRRRASRPIY